MQSTNCKVIISESEKQTRDIAKKFFESLKESDIVLLIGQLGSGKTTFVKGIIEANGGIPEYCQSPTFILAQEFTGKKNILHIDLYRLDKDSELEDFYTSQITDYLNTHIIIIEWGEKIDKLLHNNKMKFKEVKFTIKNENSRVINFII